MKNVFKKVSSAFKPGEPCSTNAEISKSDHQEIGLTSLSSNEMDQEDSEQPAAITLGDDQQLQPSEFNLLPSFSGSSCASVGLLAVIPEKPHHPSLSLPLRTSGKQKQLFCSSWYARNR